VSFPSERTSPLRLPERVPAALLLPDATARGLLPLALSLARAWGSELAAYDLKPEGAHLPDRLQHLIAGHKGSVADLAVHNLIASAFRGSQIPLRPLAEQPPPIGNTASLRMLGCNPGGPQPNPAQIASFCTPFEGTFLLLLNQGRAAFEEVLVVGWEQSSRDQLDALNRLARGLEGPYPLWRLKASKRSEIERAQTDLSERSLLLIVPCEAAGLPLDRLQDVAALSPGPVVLLCPASTQRTDYLASALK
jgi:hypothetical protein